MKWRRVGRLCFMVALLGLVALCSCAKISGRPELQRGSDAADGLMTQGRMELIFADQVDAIMGPPGAIQTQVDGINIYLISDPVHDLCIQRRDVQ